MKIVFWLFIAADTAALCVLFIFGLAAATMSKDSPASVAAHLLVIPGLCILAAALEFTRANAPAWRALAMVLAALPWLTLFTLRGNQAVKLRLNSDADGHLAYFHAGPLRDIATAIGRNDTATVASLAHRANLNSRGYSGVTLLLLSLRQLRQTPQQLSCLRALLDAGADPNIGTDYESPLQIAIQVSRNAGPEPVTRLLAAGADPNRLDAFGTPAYFAGVAVGPEMLAILLDHGANLKATDRNGLTVVFAGASSGSWKAVLLLLQRGAPSGARRSHAPRYRRVLPACVWRTRWCIGRHRLPARRVRIWRRAWRSISHANPHVLACFRAGTRHTSR